MGNIEKFVDTVAKHVISQIELIYKGGIKKRLVGMQVPGVEYQEDDYHYFSYFSVDLFARKKDVEDFEFDMGDDKQFYGYIHKMFAFPEELLPQLQKKLEKWAKETDPDYGVERMCGNCGGVGCDQCMVNESEDKTEKFHSLIIKNLLKKTEFYVDVVEKKGEEYNFIEVLLPRILVAVMDGAGYDEMINDMMSHYGLQGEEEVKIVIDRYMDVVDKFMEEYDRSSFNNDRLYKISDYINEW